MYLEWGLRPHTVVAECTRLLGSRASAGTGPERLLIFQTRAIQGPIPLQVRFGLLVGIVYNGNVVTSLPEPFDWLFEKARFGLFRS